LVPLFDGFLGSAYAAVMIVSAAVMTVSAAVAAVFTVTGSVWCFLLPGPAAVRCSMGALFSVVFFEGGGIAMSLNFGGFIGFQTHSLRHFASSLLAGLLRHFFFGFWLGLFCVFLGGCYAYMWHLCFLFHRLFAPCESLGY
jgi:hypothetical protein